MHSSIHNLGKESRSAKNLLGLPLGLHIGVILEVGLDGQAESIKFGVTSGVIEHLDKILFHLKLTEN